jgi:predicted pyridoxine 5'-phosphate oxidase superfamily flavin-nucleotide-binding protein
MKFHEGELEVQARAQVRQEAARNGVGIHAEIPPQAYYFLHQRRFAILGFMDEEEQVWASLVTGSPGFLQATDSNHLAVNPGTNLDPLLARSLRNERDLGMLVIDFATRRRMRFNGKARIDEHGIIQLRTREVFGNCPRYIQMRTLTEARPSESAAQEVRSSSSGQLFAEQADLIRQSDTFFIATADAGTGSDVSHRGGQPGFVKVVTPSQLMWPDYDGNKMFQTLGNLALNPAAGLLFIDFAAGATLQLTGKAEILWEPKISQQFSGAQRVIRFSINHAIETRGVIPFQWNFVEYSPHNPQQK